jgi:FkbM family methyltransferase
LKKIVKCGLKQLIDGTVALLGRTSGGRYLYSQVIHNAMGRTQKVEHMGLSLTFSIPNELNKYRAETFSTKEPETLEWIDGIPNGSVVWDIGANVGLYSCYAAKQRGCRVFAFEPSVFNLELLARNIFINGLTEQITIVPLPLSDVLAISKLNMTTTEWGGALSTFGQEYGYEGLPMVNIKTSQAEELVVTGQSYGRLKVFEFPTIGLSMDEAVNLLKIPQPDYIKMDVDGIEHLILKGALTTLNNTKGVLIEINDEFSTQANDASVYLQQAGFSLKEKRHADEYNTGSGMNTFNQIWVK